MVAEDKQNSELHDADEQKKSAETTMLYIPTDQRWVMAAIREIVRAKRLAGYRVSLSQIMLELLQLGLVQAERSGGVKGIKLIKG